MVIEAQEILTPHEKSRVWWRGATISALKGIPQGILLGIGAAFVLFGVIALMTVVGGPIGAMGVWTAHAFGGFVYSQSAVAALATATTPATVLPIITSVANIGLVPIVLFNTVLTAVGNFLNGGDIALAKFQQQFDHMQNQDRLGKLEAREQALEQAVASSQTATSSQAVESILARGTTRRDQGFAAMEEARAAQAIKQQLLQ